MKVKKILLILFVIIICIFGIYKFHNYKLYKMEPFYLTFYFKDSINVKTVDVKNKISYDEMTFKNLFSGFKKGDEDNIFIKYDKKKNPLAYYTIDIYPLFINSLSEESFNFYNTEDKEKKFYTEDNMIKYLDKHNINTDLDLIKYIKDNFPLGNNIFSSTKTMRNKRLLYVFANISLSSIKAITPIEGDLTGYIVEYFGSNNKDIHLQHKDKQYCINLYGDEITTNEFVYSLLESITFNNND